MSNPYKTFLKKVSKEEKISFKIDTFDAIQFDGSENFDFKGAEVDFYYPKEDTWFKEEKIEDDIRMDVEYFVLESSHKKIKPIKVEGWSKGSSEYGYGYEWWLTMSNELLIGITFDGWEEWFITLIKGEEVVKQDVEDSEELMIKLNKACKYFK